MADITNMPMADNADLELAVATLKAKAKYYDKLFAYYEGDQPLVYSSERLGAVFEGLNARFTQNWCAVVVDSVQERITLQRILVADNDAATEQLSDLLTSSELMLEADDAHMAALVTGESYIIVWPDIETGEPEAFYNDPRCVHLFYDADNPRRKRFAVKWWVGDDNHRHLTLYYSDRLEYYRSMNAVRSISDGTPTISNDVNNGKSFVRVDDAPNDYDEIPVFHFRRDRRVISSELQNVLSPQDAINKLLADMMIAAEFGAFKQRWVISDADISKLKNAPNQIWGIPAGDGEGQPTSVGEFDITPLENYLKAIDKWVTSIAIITRTPKHYFFEASSTPSGEALIAMESPLNHKAQKYIDRFMSTWSELGQFMLRVAGTSVADNAVIPVFDKPQTVQPYTQALIRKEGVQAGLPLLWLMEQEGYTEQELADLEAAKQKAAAEQRANMAQAMTDAQRNFDQGDSGSDSNA